MSEKIISLDNLIEYDKQMKDKYIEPLENKIDDIKLELTSDNFETESTYVSRTTADGRRVENGSKAILQKVVGNTIVVDNALKSASFSGIESKGKNLIPFPYYYDYNVTIAGVTFTVQTDGGIKIEGTATGGSPSFYVYSGDLNLKPGVSYTLSGASNKAILNARKEKKDGTITPWIDVSQGGSLTGMLDEGEKCCYIGIFIPEGTAVNETVYPMLNEGNIALPYELYTSSAFNFPSVELGLGTTIDFEQKKIIDNSVELIFKGTEGGWVFYPHTITGSVAYWGLPANENSATGICTDAEIKPRFSAGTNVIWLGADTTSFYWLGCLDHFGFSKNFASPSSPTKAEQDQALADFKVYLAERYANGNPVTIRYLSSTLKTETDFTPEQLASGNEYTVWDNGTETILNDNAEYGALTTLTQKYEVDSMTSRIDTIESIAKGANQAVSYNNYSEMISALNALPASEYRVGQNIMIVTLNVPDLWISDISDEYSNYEYTSDSNFIHLLQSGSGKVQIGYYVVSALETQKVDLTSYPTKSEVETSISNKANKSEVYTKTESDNKYATKTNVDGSVKYGDIIQNTNPFGGKKLYISKIDDAFYVLNKRANVSAKLYLKSDNSFVRDYTQTEVSQLFDGNYETSLEIPAGNYVVVDMLFDNYWDIFGGYPYGDIIISHYSSNKSESISVKCSKIKNPTEENWANDSDAPNIPIKDFVNNNNNQFIKIASNTYPNQVYPVHAIRMKVVAPDDIKTNVVTVEMSVERPDPKLSPFVSKYWKEYLFFPLTAPEFIGKLTGTADKAISDGFGNDIAYTYAKKQDIPAIPAIPEMPKIVEFYNGVNPFKEETTLKFLYKTKNLLNVGGRTKATAGDSSNTTARNFDENTYCVGLAASNWWGELNISSYSIEDNSVKVTIGNNGYGMAFPVKCKPLTTYLFSCNNVNNDHIRIGYYKNDGTFIRYTELYKFQDAEFTTPEDCYWMTVCFTSDTLNVESVYTDISLKTKSTDNKMRMILTTQDFGQRLINGETVTNNAGVSITLNENDTVAVPKETNELATTILNMVYPIGSIYISVNQVSPATFLGGEWEALSQGYTLWTTTTENTGGYTIPAGLPDIQGSFYVKNTDTSNSVIPSTVGAFTKAQAATKDRVVYDRSSEEYKDYISFYASLSNSIYGNSSTVQPPAIRVYMWKRIS